MVQTLSGRATITLCLGIASCSTWVTKEEHRAACRDQRRRTIRAIDAAVITTGPLAVSRRPSDQLIFCRDAIVGSFRCAMLRTGFDAPGNFRPLG
jgi:hypothetical protein